MSTTATETLESRHFVGGDWAAADSGATFDVHDPFTGEVVVRAAAGTRVDAERAIDAAQTAFPEWAATPPAVRQGIFLKAADVLESKRDEIVGLLARETGCTFGFGMTSMLHRFPGEGPFGARLQLAQLEQVVSSRAAATALSESYVGLPIV